METTKLYRHIQSAEFHGKKIIFDFLDEFGKLTVAKYKLVKRLESNINDFYNYIWRLDGRSVRYMRRVKIIENSRGLLNGSTSESNRPRTF